MASLDLHELQTRQEGAAAAVAALYFCCLAGTAFNLRLTGFKLYIPISIAAAGTSAGVRLLTVGVTHQAHCQAHCLTAIIDRCYCSCMCSAWIVIFSKGCVLCHWKHQPDGVEQSNTGTVRVALPQLCTSAISKVAFS